MKPFDQARNRAAADASLWVARRDSGLDPAAEREFRAWLEADPAHAAAWREMNGAWEAFAPAGEPGLASAMVSELRRRGRRRAFRRWSLTAAACAALGVALTAGRIRQSETARSPAAAAVETLVTRPELRRLSDGSEVELNTGAQIAVDYSPARRGIRLLRGEAHFSVAKNPARPFEVTAGLIRVRALGTRFAVRLQPDAMEILVTDGQVAVEQSSAGAQEGGLAPAILVAAGNQLSLPLGGRRASARPVPVERSESERWLAWRGPRLVLSNTPLAEAVAALNRENSVRIVAPDPELAAMRLSGVFRADNADGFVRLLEASYGIRAQRRPGEVILRGAGR